MFLHGLSLLVACGPGDSGDSPLPAAPVLDTDAPFHLTPDEPSFSAAEVQSLLVEALAYGLPDPVVADQHYRDVFLEGDGQCPPALTPEAGFSMPERACVSEGGTVFSGVAGYAADPDLDPATDDWEMGICSFVITSPEGDIFRCGGTYGYSKEDTGDGWRIRAFVQAMISWPTGPAWAALGTSSAYVLEGRTTEGGVAYTLEGSFAYAGTDLFFDAFTYDPAVCAGLPVVAGRLRDPSGYWYRFSAGEGCDPCGALTYEGVELGAVCVDATEAAATLSASLVPA